MADADDIKRERKRAADKKYYLANREYKMAKVREWQKNNPEKLKANLKKSYRNNRDKRAAYQQQYHQENRDSRVEYCKKYFQANKDLYRRDKWRRRNLPAPTRPTPDVCECCGKPPGKRALALDHCHETKQFRGWLCGKCNTAIGSLGDTLDGLQMAIEYLQRFLSTEARAA